VKLELLNPAPVADTLEGLDVGEPPCTGCPFYQRCKVELLACRAFADYVDGNRWSAGPRTPTAEQFKRTFASDYEPAKPAKPKRRSAYVAARLAAIRAGAA
jgi:hypothetical protein